MELRITPQEILLRMADYIEEHGWTRHKMWDRRGRVCTFGALEKVTLTDPEAYMAAYGARRLLMEKVGEVTAWNDNQPIFGGKKNVIATLRKIAVESNEADQ